MLTITTIAIIITASLLILGALGIVLDILGALGLVLAVPIAIAGKEVIFLAIGIAMYIYLKKHKVF